jgi:hypothetical protein
MPLIPIDPQLVTHFNRSIMRLLRPEHLRDEKYVTDFYCSVHYHPTDETAWPLLNLPENEFVPIHVEAEGEELKQLLDVFVENQGLTIEEAEEIKEAIGILRGQQIRIADMIPESWQPYIMTQDQATVAGYF